MSVKPTPVSAVPGLGLVSVNVSVVVAFTTMLAAPNALAIVGGATAGGRDDHEERHGRPARPALDRGDGARGVVLEAARRRRDVHRERAGAARGDGAPRKATECRRPPARRSASPSRGRALGRPPRGRGGTCR